MVDAMKLDERPQTLGEAARYIATFTPATVKPPGEGWSWGEVAAVVDGLMKQMLNIYEYSLDDRFVEELRLS